MNRFICLTVFVSSLFMDAFSQSLPPETIVQHNLDAYNNRNIEEFSKWLHPDVALYEMGQSVPLLTGKEKVAARYQTLFSQSPQLHSTLLQRISIGNKVIDHEKIVGRNGQMNSIYLVVIYEVADELIYRLTIIRE